MAKIKLASGSPRRRELLQLLDLDFEVVTGKDVDESAPEGMQPELLPEYLSRVKAAAYASDLADNEVLITADTIVICDGRAIGKPKDEEHAKQMLRGLSGKTHKVVTGVTVTAPMRDISFSVETFVEFAPLSDAEIERYVTKYRPLDKAGAYGIQEWIGAAGIKSINGSFYNVMGLPVQRLHQVLKEFGID